MSDDRVTIYTAPDAPACPQCGAPLVLVKARAAGRTWPALCCRRCDYWRPYKRRPRVFGAGPGDQAERDQALNQFFSDLAEMDGNG